MPVVEAYVPGTSIFQFSYNYGRKYKNRLHMNINTKPCLYLRPVGCPSPKKKVPAGEIEIVRLGDNHHAHEILSRIKYRNRGV